MPRYIKTEKYLSPSQGASYSPEAAFPISDLLQRVEYTPNTSLYKEKRVSYIP